MNKKKKAPDQILRFFDKYRFLSNFWLAPIAWSGYRWPSVENAYQAAKTPQSDHAFFFPLFVKMSPSDAKRAGKGTFTVDTDGTTETYSFILREDWDSIKFDIMYELVFEKFNQNANLCEMLLATGEAHLEEGNTRKDRIWGVCPPGSGRGANWLGKILMTVRMELRSGFRYD